VQLLKRWKLTRADLQAIPNALPLPPSWHLRTAAKIMTNDWLTFMWYVVVGNGSHHTHQSDPNDEKPSGGGNAGQGKTFSQHHSNLDICH